jgi:hypothetical protein
MTMIAKAVKGRGFRGALAYDLGKHEGRVIDTNMTGADARELAAEFGEIRKLRPRLGKAVLHVSLSAAPGEHLSDAQWRAIGGRYLHGMGLDCNQYVLTRHSDTEHEHVHLLANRIRFDGSVTSDSHDYRRQEALMRGIERDYGLQRVISSNEAERHAATKGEIEAGLRTGLPSARQQLQQLCDAAMAGCRSFTDYVRRLEAAGAALVPVTQLAGSKLSGLSYGLDGVTMKGSDLGKRYSPAGLAKHGVSYDKERDYETACRCLERSQGGRHGQADRGTAPSEARERGAADDDTGAVGAGDGRPDRRNTRDDGRDRATEHGTRGEVPDAARSGEQSIPAGGDGSASRGTEHSRSRTANRYHPLPARPGDGARHGDARERILALAGPALGEEPTRSASGSGIPTPRDRSREAVERQISALRVNRLRVLLQNPATGTIQVRRWKNSELMKGIAWLKRMNARGNNILIQPDEDGGLVLVTKLAKDALGAMDRGGFEPAVTIETRPGTFQAWVRLTTSPASANALLMASEDLARRFSGVADTAGYLAGFTVHDTPSESQNLRQFALAHAGRQGTASFGAAYMAKVAQELQAQAERSKQRSRGYSR